MCCLCVSHATEREAGDSRGGSGADGHRLPARRLWLPEERRRDAERSVGQPRGAGRRHSGETGSNHSDLGQVLINHDFD